MSAVGFYGGLQIIEDRNMVDFHEDWSQVRSPGRAKRRRRRGFPQRIRITATPKMEAIQFGNKIIMHPDMARLLRAKLTEAQP